MFYTIYKTTNLINGKIYVGAHSCSDVNDSYMGSGGSIKSAIKKYGKHNFSKQILFLADSEEEMFDIERVLVDKTFIKRKDVYNKCEGGLGNINLGQHVVEHGIGIHALQFEERSENSKRMQANLDPDKKFANASKGGKAGAASCIAKKSGIFGLQPEERKVNQMKGIDSQRINSTGFFDPEVQSKNGKNGGKKNIGCKWYNDGVNTFKYMESESTTFEKFLEENPSFIKGRFKVAYKARPKQSGKKCVTDGKTNMMFDSEELAMKFIDVNKEFRLGRTNTNKSQR